MFISIDHIPHMEIYIRKEQPVEPIIINLNHVIKMVPFRIYPNDIPTEITKIQMINHSYIYLPFPWEETMSMIRHSAKLSDFRLATGDYYVEVRKYLSPADMDKSQLEELAKLAPSL